MVIFSMDTLTIHTINMINCSCMNVEYIESTKSIDPSNDDDHNQIVSTLSISRCLGLRQSLHHNKIHLHYIYIPYDGNMSIYLRMSFCFALLFNRIMSLHAFEIIAFASLLSNSHPIQAIHTHIQINSL